MYFRVDECVDGCNKSFFCHTGSVCVERAAFCDGTTHCPDGSDEKVRILFNLI